MKFNEQTTANTYIKTWYKNYCFNILKNPVENIIENIKELESENIFTNEMIMFFDNKKFAPIYVTKNIETILGYPQQQFLDWGKDALLNIGAFKHPEFWNNLSEWLKDSMEIELISKKPTTTFRVIIGGFCYSHIDGRRKKFLFQSKYPIGENKVMPNYHFVQLKDIGHLLKENGYWYYCEKVNGNKKVSKFYSKNNTSDYPISNREKEVLKLIALGMDSKEIAEKLFISLETVKTHRKNMINRLRAKDTSSLIQICKSCEFI